MKKRKSRNFSIASAGRDLFNGLYYEYTDTSFTAPQNKRCMRSIIYNLFSSDYDDLLEKNNLHLRKASYSEGCHQHQFHSDIVFYQYYQLHTNTFDPGCQ